MSSELKKSERVTQPQRRVSYSAPLTSLTVLRVEATRTPVEKPTPDPYRGEHVYFFAHNWVEHLQGTCHKCHTPFAFNRIDNACMTGLTCIGCKARIWVDWGKGVLHYGVWNDEEDLARWEGEGGLVALGDEDGHI